MRMPSELGDRHEVQLGQKRHQKMGCGLSSFFAQNASTTLLFIAISAAFCYSNIMPINQQGDLFDYRQIDCSKNTAPAARRGLEELKSWIDFLRVE